ncbi:outer membrane protein assembly factor BamD [Oligoflexaceae bacterium]|nr:outer membrane protein assembly factor BamD [Oligoflexaceae bacterium]
MRKVLMILTILLSPFLSCVDDNYDANDASESFLRARQDYDDENYAMAIQSLGEFKARFPYSKLATVTELMIADSHFQLEQFEEAAVNYRQFAKLHPKHEKVEFSLYRVGLCYWYLSPEEIDRDQNFTKQAVDEWRKLIDRAPNNDFSLKARKLIKEGHLRIAENQEFAAKFYCKLEKWAACAFRSLAVANEYPEFKSMKKESLLRAGKALKILSEIKRKDPDSDANTYFNLMSADDIAAESGKVLAEAKTL